MYFEKHPLSPQTRGAVALTFIFALLAILTVDRPANVTPTGVPPVVIRNPTSKKEIVRGDITKKQIIFTFDGGDGADSSDEILATLQKHHVTGSFFLTGKFVERNPDLVRLMVAEGDEIYNHTYDHPHLTELTDAQIAEELAGMERVLIDTAHISPKPYFRAPYGDRDDRVRDAAYRAGYESVYWTEDARDWEEPQGKTADDVRQSILSTLAPGNIYLMHFGDSITGKILDDVFTNIESQGYTIVSLTQGL